MLDSPPTFRTSISSISGSAIGARRTTCGPVVKRPLTWGVETERFTFLARGVEFKGIIHFDGTIRIDGRVEGEIHASASVIVGEHAVVKGVVSAGTVIHSGEMNATVTARERIQLSKSSLRIGDIRTRSIGIEDGVHFHGMCDMGAHKWVEEQPSSQQPITQFSGYRGRSRSAGH